MKTAKPASVEQAEAALKAAKAHYPNHHAVSSIERAYEPIDHPVNYDERAHGNIQTIETCSCGAIRRINRNAGFEEVGQWEYAQLYQQINSAHAAVRQDQADAAIIKSAGAKIIRTDEGKTAILVQVGEGAPKWVGWTVLRDAAQQRDSGDGLAPFYGALYRTFAKLCA